MTNDYYFDPRCAEAYDADMGAEADAMNDTPFYLALAREAAARGLAVLELACGTGRVTLPIAREGIEVVGLDSAPAMLDVARRKAAAEDLDVTWIEADMRDFDLGRRFGLIIIPYRSFLHLLTDADQAACLAAVYRHLIPGGRFALNFFAPPLPRSADGGEPLISRIHRQMRLRYVSKDEMETLLRSAGFELEATYGGFNNESLTPASHELIWIASRPDVTQVVINRHL
jgi:ubiquinone/menaquinone biosynthesis C-methylase UbiE